MEGFQCEVPGCQRKYFKTKWTYDRHCERIHGSDYSCPKCNEKFDSKVMMTRHKKKAHRGFTCHLCHTGFSDQRFLNRHHARFLSGVKISTHFCSPCGLQFKSVGEYKLHMVASHTNPTSFKLLNSAFRKTHQDWRKILATTMQPESLFYGDYNKEIINFLTNQQQRLKNFTYNMVLVCIYECPLAKNNDTFRQGKTENLFSLNDFYKRNFVLFRA